MQGSDKSKNADVYKQREMSDAQQKMDLEKQLEEALKELEAKTEKIGNLEKQLMLVQCDLVASQKETIKAQGDLVMAQKETVTAQRESVTSQRESVTTQKETVMAQNETVTAQKEALKAREETEKALVNVVKAEEDMVKTQAETLQMQKDTLDAQKDSEEENRKMTQKILDAVDRMQVVQEQKELNYLKNQVEEKAKFVKDQREILAVEKNNYENSKKENISKRALNVLLGIKDSDMENISMSRGFDIAAAKIGQIADVYDALTLDVVFTFGVSESQFDEMEDAVEHKFWIRKNVNSRFMTVKLEKIVGGIAKLTFKNDNRENVLEALTNRVLELDGVIR